MNLSTKNILSVVAGLSVAVTLMGESSFGRGAGGGGRGMSMGHSSMGHSSMGHSSMGHHNMSYQPNFSNHSNRSFTNSNHMPRNFVNNNRISNHTPHNAHMGRQHIQSMKHSRMMGKHLHHHHKGPYWKHYGSWGFDDDSSGFGWDCWLEPECGGWVYYEPLPVDEYYNPYVAAEGTVDGADYSLPISRMDQRADADDDADAYAAARDAFRQGDLNAALKFAAQAVAAAPRNRDVHQFHALVLFAKRDFRKSAAVAHAALQGGPGWNWNILRTCYSNAENYTEELRGLERAVTENPSAADIRFLLAYHYLMLNHVDSAERQLQAVVEVEPKDKLAGRILQAIGGSDEDDKKVSGVQMAAGTVKGQTIKSDSVNTATIETDSVKSDTLKTDAVKTDAAQSDSVQSDSVKADTVKADTAKMDAAKTNSVKSARLKSLLIKTGALKSKKVNDDDQGDDDDSDDDDEEDTTADAQASPKTSTQSAAKIATPVTSTVAEPGLNGSWKATPADGVQIELTLRADQTFDWKFTSNGTAKEFHGKFRLNGKMLSLTRNGDGTAMEGTIEISGDKAFQFRMKNSEADDPGLSFTPVTVG